MGLSSLEPEARKAHKEKWTESLIADIDRHFPGIAGAVVHREMATAETMQQYLNTPGGAVYGFAPEGTAGDALLQGPHTAIDGLWLASTFTSGGGIYRIHVRRCTSGKPGDARCPGPRAVARVRQVKPVPIGNQIRTY